MVIADQLIDGDESRCHDPVKKHQSSESWNITPNHIRSIQVLKVGIVSSYRLIKVTDQNEKVRTSRLKLPGWITETIWDFQAYRAYNGWKVSLRPWNTRPSDTPIFTYAENGMLREMLEAFRDNLASPWDRDEDGETLLHV